MAGPGRTHEIPIPLPIGNGSVLGDLRSIVKGVVVEALSASLNDSQKFTLSRANLVDPHTIQVAPDLHSMYRGNAVQAEIGARNVIVVSEPQAVPHDLLYQVGRVEGVLTEMKHSEQPSAVLQVRLSEQGKRIIFPVVGVDASITVMQTDATKFSSDGYPLHGALTVGVIMVAQPKDGRYDGETEGARVYKVNNVNWNPQSGEVIDVYRARIGASKATAHTVKANAFVHAIDSPVGGQPEKKKR